MGASFKFKFSLLILFGVAYALLYLLPNFHPYFTPFQLPMFAIDRKVPFLPWTFTIYMSDYLLALLVILAVNTLDDFKSLSRSAFLALFLSGVFFILAPTVYPRPAYPTHQNFFIQALLNMIAVSDKPTNCFPSMHVAMAAIFTWAMRYRRKVYGFFWLWTLAIALSTLTTKQHYFIDIIGGFSVMIIVVAVEYLVFQKRLFQLWRARSSV